VFCAPKHILVNTRLLQSFAPELPTGLQIYITYAFKSAGDTAPDFWCFQKIETHMQDRLPSSTENRFREEERDSRVFLKTCDEPASQLNRDRDKIFNFPENNFFQQTSQRCSSYGIFAFGKSDEAVKSPETHYETVPCFNPHCFFGFDGNAVRPTDHERATSFVRHTQLAIEDDMLHLMRQQCNTWIAHLEKLGNDEERFCSNSQISLEMLNRITLMDEGAPELLEKLSGLLQVKDVTPLRNMKPRNTFPTKSSTSLKAGDAASSFEWRPQCLLCKRFG